MHVFPHGLHQAVGGARRARRRVLARVGRGARWGRCASSCARGSRSCSSGYAAIFVALILGDDVRAPGQRLARAATAAARRRARVRVPPRPRRRALLDVPPVVAVLRRTRGAGGWGAARARAARAAARAAREPEGAALRAGEPLLLRPDAAAGATRARTSASSLAAIRAGKGRIGLADVMRVTGPAARAGRPADGAADARLRGRRRRQRGRRHRLPLRRAAEDGGRGDAAAAEPPPAWTRAKPLPPLTGNSAGANLAIAALNAFNLLMGVWAIENGMTLERVAHLFDRVPLRRSSTPALPIALGVVPLVFSALLFVVPVARAVARPLRKRAAARGEGPARRAARGARARARQAAGDRRGGRARPGGVPPGATPRAKRLDRELVALGRRRRHRAERRRPAGASRTWRPRPPPSRPSARPRPTKRRGSARSSTPPTRTEREPDPGIAGAVAVVVKGSHEPPKAHPSHRSRPRRSAPAASTRAGGLVAAGRRSPQTPAPFATPPVLPGTPDIATLVAKVKPVGREHHDRARGEDAARRLRLPRLLGTSSRSSAGRDGRARGRVGGGERAATR